MPHANATLTPAGRLRLAKLVVDQRWSYARAAERFSVSVTTARRWAGRYRELGKAGMHDRSSRPHRCPNQLPQRTERRIVKLRVTRRWGPARIAYHLGLNPSTVHQVLRRYGCPRLKWTDPATGTRIKTSSRDKRRYEHPAAGDLIHVDIKKLGRIPDGGGWRMFGRDSAQHRRSGAAADRAARAGASPSRGYVYLHHAVDDHSRLAYSEILPDEKGATCAGFLLRAADWFAHCGVDRIQEVMTDNHFSYKLSTDMADAIAALGAKHIFIKAHCPWQNGKVERLNRTLQTEWAYRKVFHSNAEREAALAPWLDYYNNRRRHSALGGRPPISRLTPRS